jgi:hypothetical protein
MRAPGCTGPQFALVHAYTNFFSGSLYQAGVTKHFFYFGGAFSYFVPF